MRTPPPDMVGPIGPRICDEYSEHLSDGLIGPFDLAVRFLIIHLEAHLFSIDHFEFSFVEPSITPTSLLFLELVFQGLRLALSYGVRFEWFIV